MIDENFEQRDVKEWVAKIQQEFDAMSPEEQEALKAANLAEREKYDNMSIQEMMAECDTAMAKAAGKPDWKYVDLPRMTHEFFNEFVNIVGEENLHWLTVAVYSSTTRGQVLISPAGRMRILSEFNDEETTS
jgi:hypothetical protein